MALLCGFRWQRFLAKSKKEQRVGSVVRMGINPNCRSSRDWQHPEVAFVNQGAVARATADRTICPNSIPDRRFPDDCDQYLAAKGWTILDCTWSHSGHQKNVAAASATFITRCRPDLISKQHNSIAMDVFYRAVCREMKTRKAVEIT